MMSNLLPACDLNVDDRLWNQNYFDFMMSKLLPTYDAKVVSSLLCVKVDVSLWCGSWLQLMIRIVFLKLRAETKSMFTIPKPFSNHPRPQRWGKVRWDSPPHSPPHLSWGASPDPIFWLFFFELARCSISIIVFGCFSYMVTRTLKMLPAFAKIKPLDTSVGNSKHTPRPPSSMLA